MGTYAPLDYVIYLGILLGVYYFFLKVVFTKIKLDKKFLLAALPYILTGVLIRVLADTSTWEANKLWSITPGVYLITIGTGLVFLFLGLKLSRERYWLFPFSTGSLISLFLWGKLFPYILYPERIFYPFGLAFLITFLVYLVSRGIKAKIFQRGDNLGCIFAHLLDGSATFIAYNFYGFGEEHLLPRFLIHLTGNSIVMIPAKLILVLLVLYVIEKYGEEESNFLKFLVFILGIGPGLRDAILPALQL